MSLCLPDRRTHFWIDWARGQGGGSSPRKYGTNCIIPELVNRGAVGWCGIRLADGTSAWLARRKKSIQDLAQLVGVHDAPRTYRRPFG